MSLGEDFDLLYERRLRENNPIAILNKSINTPDPHGNPKTYCMDFDGVLHYHETGSGPGPLTEPLEPGIKMAKRIKAAGHKLVILTARPEEQFHDIEGWLKGNGVKADEVTNKKPPAIYYVDDRALPWPRNAKESFGERLKRFDQAVFREGGSGSGNFGHSGRPGEVGGAGPGGGEAPPKKERKKGYKIGEKYGLVGMKPGFKVELAKEMFGGRHYKELKYAEKKQVKDALRARGIIRPKGSTEASGNEKALQEAAVVSKKFLGGGIEDTSKVQLEGGLTGVFKVSGGGAKKENEVGSWQVAKLVGLEDIHPPTVFREIEGQKGSMQQFWQGTLASKVTPARDMYDGEKDLARAAAFDYIIGNSDRHANNWLVDQGNNKLQLIDHGRCFPERPFTLEGAHYSMFARKLGRADGGAYRQGEADYKPAMSPREAAKPYVEKKEQILKALKETGIKETAIQGVSSRIDRLARKDKWGDL